MCCPPGPIGKLWWVVVSCCPRNVGSGASEPKSIDAPRRGWKLEVLGTSRSGLAFPWFPGIFWGIFRDLHVGYGWFSRVYDSVNFEFLDVNSGKKLMITNVLIYIYIILSLLRGIHIIIVGEFLILFVGSTSPLFVGFCSGIPNFHQHPSCVTEWQTSYTAPGKLWYSLLIYIYIWYIYIWYIYIYI